MLEILRVLAYQPTLVIRNPIVFLFNGAEELGLQGAHGFVRGKTDHLREEWGHEWAQNLSVFLNLEGAGGGGREILFQATGGSKHIHVLFACGDISFECMDTMLISLITATLKATLMRRVGF